MKLESRLLRLHMPRDCRTTHFSGAEFAGFWGAWATLDHTSFIFSLLPFLYFYYSIFVAKGNSIQMPLNRTCSVWILYHETPDIATGTFISSHSWRKTGASALALFCSLFHVKNWGMWKSTSSCERYIDDTFTDPDGFMKALFDWMSSPDANTHTDWGDWEGYDGPQDEADDGVTDPTDDA